MTRLLVIAALLVLYGLVGVQGCSIYDCIGGYKYTKCELARHLIQLGVARSEVAPWVCSAQFESQFCTCTSPQGYYGIFGINGYFNCDEGLAEGIDGCNKPCSAFTNTDLSDDIVCMRHILREHGHNWDTVSNRYVVRCHDIIGTYLSECGTLPSIG